jgi:acetylornithine deacetylase
MAKKYEGVSAIDKSIDLIRLLYEYEGRLTGESSDQPLFSEYDHPVQVNIGRMEAGDWPATVPGMSMLEGGVGFLPNRDLAGVKADLRELMKKDEWLLKNGKIEFDRLHNDAYQIPKDHPLSQQMVRSAQAAGIETRVRGMIASCDARLFNRVGGMPTIVFGAGDIDQAHSSGESVSLEELALEASALFHMACAWCGTA